jgi:hypothetical protein
VSADTIRLWFTYGLATLILVASFSLLLIPSQVTSEQLIPFVTGIIGTVIGWLFNRESTTAGQRSSERAVTLGASTANTPTVTIQEGQTK